jgi:hypothetical protein
MAAATSSALATPILHGLRAHLLPTLCIDASLICLDPVSVYANTG